MSKTVKRDKGAELREADPKLVCQKVSQWSVSLRVPAFNCNRASAPAADQNFSLLSTGWLSSLTVDSMRLLAIGRHCLRYWGVIHLPTQILPSVRDDRVCVCNLLQTWNNNIMISVARQSVPVCVTRHTTKQGVRTD